MFDVLLVDVSVNNTRLCFGLIACSNSDLMKRGKLPHLVSISTPHVTCVYLCFPNSKRVVYDLIY